MDNLATIYRDADGDLAHLTGKNVAVLGYGNQGRSQALNLRDSGVNVLIGNIADEYRERALAEGFTPLPIAEAVAQADATMILLPDEVMTDLFPRDIQPHLKPGSALCFASGYNVTYELVKPPANVDVILLAPRMIGVGVRDLYVSGEGFFSFLAIEQNATGNARAVLLALAKGIGTLRKGGVEITFRMEAELDLFNEQGFGPAFGRVLLGALQTLIDAGYPKEAVLLELYMSGEFGYICREMAETGLIKQLDFHSQTSQYGAISRGISFLGVNVMKPMKRILQSIVSGRFAREWQWERRTGKLRFRFLRAMAVRQPISHWENEVRQTLGLDQ